MYGYKDIQLKVSFKPSNTTFFFINCSLPPLLFIHQWLWGNRNSTQDPLTPISSPGAPMPLGQCSPNGHAVVLSPGQMATRWDQAWRDRTPAALENRGCFFMGHYSWFWQLKSFRVFISVLFYFPFLGDSSSLFSFLMSRSSCVG